MNRAVAILVGILPLYVIRFSFFGIPTTIFEIAVWTTLLLVVFRRALSFWPRGQHPGAPRQLAAWIPDQIRNDKALQVVIFCSVLFLFSAVISTAISAELRSSLGVLKSWIITPMLFGFLVYVHGKREQVIRSLVVSGLAVALFGISQIHGSNRIYSLYDVPNSLALFLVPICIISAWIGIKNRSRFYQYSAVVMLIAIIFTQSFGAIFALVGTMIVGWRIFSPSYKGGKYVLLLSVFLIIITIFTFSGRLSYLLSPITHPGTTNSATVRLQLWDIGLDLIKKHPILGIGLGQFEPAYQAELHRRFAAVSSQPADVIPDLIRNPRQLQPEFVFRDPHNWLISFWLNTGLLGLVSFIALNYFAIHRAFSPPYEGGAGGCSHVVYRQAIALAIISMLIFGLFETIYWKNDLSALWWMLICIILRSKS